MQDQSQITPQAFKSMIVQKYPDGVASDGTKYSDMDSVKLTQSVVSKYPNGVTNAGVKYSAYLPKPITMSDIPAVQGYKKYLNGVSDAASAADDQISQGFDEFDKAGYNPLKMVEGGLTGAAGLFNKVTSPIAPFFGPIGRAINAVSGKISDIPAVQKFANSPAGSATAEAAQDIGNVATVAQGALIADGVVNAKPSPEYVGPTSPAEAPTVPPAEPGLTPADEAVVSKRTDALNQIEKNNGPVRRVVGAASDKGIDVKTLVSNTDLLHDSVDENGSINTTAPGGAIDQFRGFMDQYEGAVGEGLKREGKSIPLSEVQSALETQVEESGIAGAGKTSLMNRVKAEIDGLRHDADQSGNISLEKLQDAKVSTTNGVDYTNPESKINSKLVASTYKTLIEDNSSLPVTDVNAELSRYYTIEDYLEALNGKKVQGGRLGRYFAQTIGGIAGSHFGILGTIIGAELAGKIKGTILSGTFGQAIGQSLEASNLLKSQVQQNSLPRLALPAPAEGAPRSSVGSGPTIPLLPPNPGP